ncbi:hypothetical protein VPH35_136437 [Triticum aestivum]|uniref:Uncharacterized protein n=2 Tax=Aegilops tauschii subsp. strangulata TaxID=200361 RepID=A0A453RA69_AEGTS|nr:uncharacterized protein LOC123164358 [Triticum aestivum]XP_045086498.1 uncharacterized protein LOC109763677 [Aegilops tauschii subsp. strangulata]
MGAPRSLRRGSSGVTSSGYSNQKPKALYILMAKLMYVSHGASHKLPFKVGSSLQIARDGMAGIRLVTGSITTAAYKTSKEDHLVNKLREQGPLVFASGDATIGNQNDDATSANETGNRLAGCWRQRSQKRWVAQQLAKRRRRTRGSANGQASARYVASRGTRGQPDIPKPVCKPVRHKNCGVEGHKRNNCRKVGDLRLNNM